MTAIQNPDHNGLEIYFGSKPDPATIDALKANRWRWHRAKQCWYNKDSEEARAFAESLGASVESEAPAPKAVPVVQYSKNVRDYVTIDEYRAALMAYYKQNPRQSGFADLSQAVERRVKYDYEKDGALAQYIRQAIVWKSIGNGPDTFHSNGDTVLYAAIWDKLPTISGLKKTGRVYSAMWGYDQTQITTATHYGRAFGLDVLVTGGYSCGEVLLKRIGKDGRFTDGCMYFSPNTYSDEKIRSTNEYASYYGR